MKIETLRQDDIELRPFEPTDAKALAKLLNDRQVSRYVTSIGYPYSAADAKKWLATVFPDYQKKIPGRFHFAIVYQGELAGGMGLHQIRPNHMVELGYWMGRKFWGRGIMTTVLQMIEKYCRENFRTIRFQAKTFPQNKASVALLKKSGYKLEGKSRKAAFKDGKYFDHHIFGKVR